MATNNATNTSNPVTVAQGGTGTTSFVAYTPVTGGTTSAAAFQSVAALGSSGQVLTSNGAGALPTFQAAAGGSSINVGSISGNWYPSGSIWGGTGNSVVAAGNLTGTLYFVPIFVSKTTVYTDIGLLTSVGAGTTVFGIYNDSGNGAPTGNPIANSNSTSVSNVGGTLSKYTFSSPISLTPATYWLAYSVSTTNTIYTCPAGGYDMGGRGLGIGTSLTAAALAIPRSGWSQSFTYNATLPSVGSLTAVTFTGSDAGNAYVFLKAQ